MKYTHFCTFTNESPSMLILKRKKNFSKVIHYSRVGNKIFIIKTEEASMLHENKSIQKRLRTITSEEWDLFIKPIMTAQLQVGINDLANKDIMFHSVRGDKKSTPKTD